MNIESREDLEVRAEETRQRLLDKVDVLEQRKDAVVDTVHRIRSWVHPLTLGALVATAAVGLVLVVRHRKRTPKPRWSLPSRPITQPSLLSRLSRELLVAGVTMLGTRVLQMGIDRVVPQPSKDLGGQ